MKSPLKRKPGRPRKETATEPEKQLLNQNPNQKHDKDFSPEDGKENDEIKKIASEHETKTRRSYKKELEEIEKSKQDAKKLTYIGSSIIGLVISRLTPNEPLSDMEKTYLDQSFTDVLEKYGESLVKFSSELALFAILAIIFVPRLQSVNEEKKKKIDYERTTRDRFDLRKDGGGEIDTGKKTVDEIPPGNNL